MASVLSSRDETAARCRCLTGCRLLALAGLQWSAGVQRINPAGSEDGGGRAGRPDRVVYRLALERPPRSASARGRMLISTYVSQRPKAVAATTRTAAAVRSTQRLRCMASGWQGRGLLRLCFSAVDGLLCFSLLDCFVKGSVCLR